MLKISYQTWTFFLVLFVLKTKQVQDKYMCKNKNDGFYTITKKKTTILIMLFLILNITLKKTNKTFYNNND